MGATQFFSGTPWPVPALKKQLPFKLWFYLLHAISSGSGNGS